MMAYASAWRWGLVCLLGFGSLVSAQVNSTECFGSKDLNRQSELQQFLGSGLLTTDCGQIWTGNISIGGFQLSSQIFDDSGPLLDLNGLAKIQGSLVISDIQVDSSSDTGSDDGSWSLHAPDLYNVNETLEFSDLEQFAVPTDLAGAMNSIVFRDISFADSAPDSYWPGLDSITSLTFTSTSIDKIGPFEKLMFAYVTDSPSYFAAVNNDNLRSVDVTNFAASTTYVNIYGNNEELAVTLPSDSQVAFLLNISNVSEINAEGVITLGVPDDSTSMQTISGNSFRTLELSNLTSIYGTLEISDNEQLNKLGLDQLGSVFNLTIANNEHLRDISLPQLLSVDSSLHISGPIDSISAPMATNVAGKVVIISSGDLDCSTVQITASNEDSFSCQKVSPPSTTSGQESPQTEGSDDDSGSDEDDHDDHEGGGGLSTGAKIGVGVGVGVGVLAIASAVLLVWCCARRNRKRSSRSAAAGEYYLTETKGGDRSPPRYSKVPAASGSAEYQSSDDQPIGSSRFGENWSPPPEQRRVSDGVEGRVELEEQQGVRHEMDARSLDGFEEDDDRVETRSLEDIERTHHRS